MERNRREQQREKHHHIWRLWFHGNAIPFPKQIVTKTHADAMRIIHICVSWNDHLSSVSTLYEKAKVLLNVVRYYKQYQHRFFWPPDFPILLPIVSDSGRGNIWFSKCSDTHGDGIFLLQKTSACHIWKRCWGQWWESGRTRPIGRPWEWNKLKDSGTLCTAAGDRPDRW